MAHRLDRFHLVATTQGAVVAVEDTPDAIDEACGLELAQRLLEGFASLDQAHCLIRARGGQVIRGRR